MGSHMVYNYISPLRVISQKVVSAAYMLCATVINKILRHVDCTLIIT
jgi:hypothetical protein